MKSPHVKMVFSSDESWEEDLEWCDMRADLTVMLEAQDIPALLAQLAGFLQADMDGGASPWFELKLRGKVYMTGRLPPQATFNRKGDPLPNVVIADDVHGWPGRTPKKLNGPA